MASLVEKVKDTVENVKEKISGRGPNKPGCDRDCHQMNDGHYHNDERVSEETSACDGQRCGSRTYEAVAREPDAVLDQVVRGGHQHATIHEPGDVGTNISQPLPYGEQLAQVRVPEGDVRSGGRVHEEGGRINYL